MICESTAKKYCSGDVSQIENYDEAISDPNRTWHLHHRRETVYTMAGLIELGEYYNRPPHELIFLTPAQHMCLHAKLHHIEGILKISEEARSRLSLMNKGKRFWNNGEITTMSKECPGEGWVSGMKKGRKHYIHRGCKNTRRYSNLSTPELVRLVLDNNTPTYERKWICENLLGGVLNYDSVRSKLRREKISQKIHSNPLT